MSHVQRDDAASLHGTLRAWKRKKKEKKRCFFLLSLMTRYCKAACYRGLPPTAAQVAVSLLVHHRHLESCSTLLACNCIVSFPPLPFLHARSLVQIIPDSSFLSRGPRGRNYRKLSVAAVISPPFSFHLIFPPLHLPLSVLLFLPPITTTPSGNFNLKLCSRPVPVAPPAGLLALQEGK